MKSREPTWEELRGLSADERRAILEYFKRINAQNHSVASSSRSLSLVLHRSMRRPQPTRWPSTRPRSRGGGEVSRCGAALSQRAAHRGRRQRPARPRARLPSLGARTHCAARHVDRREPTGRAYRTVQLRTLQGLGARLRFARAFDKWIQDMPGNAARIANTRGCCCRRTVARRGQRAGARQSARWEPRRICARGWRRRARRRAVGGIGAGGDSRSSPQTIWCRPRHARARAIVGAPADSRHFLRAAD